MDVSLTLHKNRPVCFYLVVQRDIFICISDALAAWHESHIQLFAGCYHIDTACSLLSLLLFLINMYVGY